MVITGAIIAGLVALIGGALTLAGVIYTARAQKEPAIIRITQDVATEAIGTLQRERDEARAQGVVHIQALAQLHIQHEALQSRYEAVVDENIELRRRLG
jgi:uncharacterized membrane protein